MSSVAPATAPQCPSCLGAEMRIFHRAGRVPTNTCIQLTSEHEARTWPVGELTLGYCEQCDFVCNVAFDARLAEYSARYEETQAASATFRAFHQQLATQLIDRYDVRNKRILEIGCGKGEFLSLLCELGGNRGLGFDPSYDPHRFGANDKVAFVRDFYSPDYAGHQADLVCCKMTLEHIGPTGEFVDMVRRCTTDPSTVVYFQVPNASRIFEQCAFEDVYYEHCSYFTATSLAALFERAGFEVLEVRSEYDDQYLAIEARPALVPIEPRPVDGALGQAVDSFAEHYAHTVRHWNARLERARERRERVAVWGSGSKAATFLHAVDDGGSVAQVVDINPQRQGHYMVGTAQRIHAPDELRSAPPDLVIVMNRIYTDEICATLDGMGLHPEIVAL